MRIFILGYSQINRIRKEIRGHDKIFLLEGYLSFLNLNQLKDSINPNREQLFETREQILKYTIEESKRQGDGFNLIKLFELELNRYLNLFIKNYLYFKNLKGNDFILIDDGNIEIQVIKDVLKYLDYNYDKRDHCIIVKKPFKLQLKNFIIKVITRLKYLFSKLFGFRDVIFIAEGNGNPLTDVIIKRMIKDTKSRIVSIFPNPKNLVKFFFTSRYSILMHSGKNSQKIKTFLPNLSKLNCFGVRLHELIPAFLNNQKIQEHFLILLQKIRKMSDERIIKKALFLFDRYPFQRLLVKTFKESSIPTYMIQHGIFGGLYPPIEVDNLFTWGSFTQEILSQQQSRNIRYINTGHYLYRSYLKKYSDLETERYSFERKFGIKLKKEVILYVTQPNDLYFLENDSYENLGYLLIEYKKHLKDFSLIIKVHPRESENIYYDILKQHDLESNVIIVRWFDPYRLLSICDRIVFMFSTMGLDAMVFNKKVFLLNLTGFKDLAGYEESNSVRCIHQKKDLVKIFKVKEIFNLEERKSFLEKYIGDYKFPGEDIIIKELTKN